MSRTNKSLSALAGAAIVLVIATWFDVSIMSDVRRHAAAAFDISGVTTMTAIGSLLITGFVLLVATLAWRAASATVGLAYIVVGGLLVALPWLVWTFATQVNDAPPVLPEPLASALANIYFSTTGPLNAVGTIGAGMLIAGIAALARSSRGRSAAMNAAEARIRAADPALP